MSEPTQEVDKARKAMYELSRGFKQLEVTEEYVVDDAGLLVLQKKRIVKKQLPPDIEAYRLLFGSAVYDDLSDEELEKEKERLLKQLLNLSKKEK